VIDPEFAFYGPMGFEIGALLANFLLSYFSQPGHNNGDGYADWVLQQVRACVRGVDGWVGGWGWADRWITAAGIGCESMNKCVAWPAPTHTRQTDAHPKN
jgi:hypothetical protein